MKKLLLAGAVFAVLVPNQTSAAELPARVDRAAAAASGFSWTGLYIGGSVGSASLQSGWSNIDPPGSGTDDADMKRSGFTGGGELGYNYQHQALVLGLVGNYTWASLQQDQTGCYAAAYPVFQPMTCNTRADRFAAVAVRLGVAWQGLLLFAKLGESWGNFNYTVGCILCPSSAYSGRETRAGRIAGGGIEYAVLENVAVKLEYEYLEFGQITVPFFGNAGDSFDQDIVNRVHLIKVGANYLLGWPR